VVEGDGAHGHTDAHLLGALGNRRGIDLGRGDETVGGEQVLGDPHLVVAELLGQLEEGEIVVEALHHLGEIGELAQAENAELGLGHGLLARVLFAHGDECSGKRQTSILRTGHAAAA
jgi:hypothetical protein